MSLLPDKTIKSAENQLISYQQLDILHALRGFCAFYVVAFHSRYVLWSGGTEYLKVVPRASWSILQYLAFAVDMSLSAGYEMVIFFFVLSGFFIRYAQQKKFRTALSFYLNRAVRIYPPYLASLALAGATLTYVAYQHPALFATSLGREYNADLLVAWHELYPVTMSHLGKTLLFFKAGDKYFGNNGVYWSLLPEALFYAAVPLAFWRIRYYYGISAALYACGMALEALHFGTGPLGKFVFVYNGYFALGVGLYDVVSQRPRWLAMFEQVRGVWLIIAFALLSLSLVATAVAHFIILSGPLAAVLAVLSVSVLLAGRVNRRNLLVRVFHEVGLFSFSLYLYHPPLLLLAYAGLVASTGLLVNFDHYYWAAVPLVTLGCYALYFVTERLAVRFFRGI